MSRKGISRPLRTLLLSVLPVCGALAFLGCGCQGNHELTPQEHLQAALENLEDEESLALNIWHLQCFLDETPDSPENESSRIVAQMHLRKCLDTFVAVHGGDTEETGAKLRDAELKAVMLEERMEEQNQLLSRLSAENQALREQLLNLQRKPLPPAEATQK